jgi:pyridoxamine 5'-phosphate oxidase
MGIEDRRIQYETAGLDIGDLDADPIVQLDHWYHQAESAKVAEPNAMVLSTVDAS